MSRPLPDGALVALTAVAVAAFVALGAAVDRGAVFAEPITDVPVYEEYGTRMADGDVPYRDFRVEYPPGALPVFVAPALLSDDEDGYARVFAALMLACGVAVVVLTAVALRGLQAPAVDAARGLALVASTPLLVGALATTRFDLWPAALAAAAAAAFAWTRLRLGGVLLGAAVAAKLYPAVVLPPLVAQAWRRRGRRAALVVAGLAVAVVLLVFVPFLVVDAEGVVRGVGRQLSRPLQIESLGAGVLLVLHDVFGMPLGWASSHGSQNLTGTVAAVAAVGLSLAQLAALGWIWWRSAARRLTRAETVCAAAASLTAFVALGKVLSPQFLVWLIPVVALVAGTRGLVASALLVVACALTHVWFPGRYWELVFEFDSLASWTVLARDVTLVALLVVLAAPLRRAAR